MKRQQSLDQIRWDLALRYRLIETIAWWEGRLTTGHLMQSFGISRQQASKDINTYLTEHAPNNLTYDRHLKGYKPSKTFRPRFIDGSAGAYLHMVNQNREKAPHISGLAVAYSHVEQLDVPDRTIRPEVLRPILKACREGLRLETEYVSMSAPTREIRVMAPHTLVYDGLRWHVRAYCEKNRGYRDFVLSRFRGEPDLMDPTEHGQSEDEGWNTELNVIIAPDTRLSDEQKEIIEADFGMEKGRLVIPTRGALVPYVLKRYQLSTDSIAANAVAQLIYVVNREELKKWII